MLHSRPHRRSIETQVARTSKASPAASSSIPPLPRNQPVEARVHRATNSHPSGLRLLQATRWIRLHVGDVEKVERQALLRQRRSLASPIPEQVLRRWQAEQRTILVLSGGILRRRRREK